MIGRIEDHAMKIDIDLASDAIALDIDGTLIDIAPTPEDVVVPDSLRASLKTLSPLLGGALAFCSGRTLAAVDALFAPLKLAAVGCHGAEVRHGPDAPVVATAPPIPEAVKRAFADVPQRLPGVRVEDKTYTLAFHYRIVPEQEQGLLDILKSRLPGVDSELVELHGKGIVELKGRGFNKGTGLAALMARAPFAGRRPVYLGDDRTDEDVFAVLGRYNGLGISVGSLLKGASAQFAAPADVRAWLARLAVQKA
jgi:trehalose 6-phosphate phosphatase